MVIERLLCRYAGNSTNSSLLKLNRSSQAHTRACIYSIAASNSMQIAHKCAVEIRRISHQTVEIFSAHLLHEVFWRKFAMMR